MEIYHIFCKSQADTGRTLEKTLDTVTVPRKDRGRPRRNPKRIIADKGYDSNPLQTRLKRRGIELIWPYRKNRGRRRYHDGRKLRRYKRRRKVERTFAWLGNHRRLVVRWDRGITIRSAFFHVACLMIMLRQLRDRFWKPPPTKGVLRHPRWRHRPSASFRQLM